MKQGLQINTKGSRPNARIRSHQSSNNISPHMASQLEKSPFSMMSSGQSKKLVASRGEKEGSLMVNSLLVKKGLTLVQRDNFDLQRNRSGSNGSRGHDHHQSAHLNQPKMANTSVSPHNSQNTSSKFKLANTGQPNITINPQHVKFNLRNQFAMIPSQITVPTSHSNSPDTGLTPAKVTASQFNRGNGNFNFHPPQLQGGKVNLLNHQQALHEKLKIQKNPSHPLSKQHTPKSIQSNAQPTDSRYANKLNLALNSKSSNRNGPEINKQNIHVGIQQLQASQVQNMAGQATGMAFYRVLQKETQRSPVVNPVILADPSIFTVSTQFKSTSPNSNNPARTIQKLQHKQESSNSNPDPSRQTLASDSLMATEISNRQREHTKHFSFQPGNLKEQHSQAQLNVSKRKVQFNVEDSNHTNQTASPQFKHLKINPLQNGGVKPIPHSHTVKTSPVAKTSDEIRAEILKQKVMSLNSSLEQVRADKGQRPDPDSLSVESKRKLIVIQPNLVKKPLQNEQQTIQALKIKKFQSTTSNTEASTTKLNVNVQNGALKLKSSNSREKIALRQPGPATQSHNLYSSNTSQTHLKMKSSSKSPGRISIASNGSNGETTAKKRIETGHSNITTRLDTGASKRLDTGASNATNGAPKILQVQQLPSQYQKSSIEFNDAKKAQSVPVREPENRPAIISQDPKDVILNQIRRYIKTNKGQEKLKQDLGKEGENSGQNTDEIINNLKDFLSYLENKGIINQTKLQNKDEMNNLLKDIMKLDLNKFSRPRHNSQPPELEKRRVLPSPALSQNRTPAGQMQIIENTNKDHARANSNDAIVHHMRDYGKRTRTNVSQAGSSEKQSASAYQNTGPKEPKKVGVLYHKVRKPGERVVVTEHSAESPKQERKKHINSLNSANFVLPSSAQHNNSLYQESNKSQNKQTPSDQKQGSVVITQSTVEARNSVYGLSGGKHLASQRSQESNKKPALAQQQQNYQVHNIMIKPKQPQTQVTETDQTVQMTDVSQQVPTIQLMINGNGGKYLGINVNNYCIAPQPVPQNNQNTQHRRQQANLDLPSEQSVKVRSTSQPENRKTNSMPQQQLQPNARPSSSKRLYTSNHHSPKTSHVDLKSGEMALEPEQEQIASSVIKIRKRSEDPNTSSVKNEKLQNADFSLLQGKNQLARQESQKREQVKSRQTEKCERPPSVSSYHANESSTNFLNSQKRISQDSKAVHRGAESEKQSQEDVVQFNENAITQEREKLIRYIKAYVKKHGTIPNTTLEFYKFIKLLGKGAFGKITLGIHKLTGKYVAIKSIDKANIKDEYSRRKVFQEVYILKKIRHSCVIRLLEVFESEKHFLMVMEYSGGGDLLQYVKKRKRLNEQSAKAIFKQILYALGHCHCRSVLHRDIKLDNVLMDGDGGVKLCDFGVSRLVKKGHTIHEQCGTPAYLAPEIIIDKGYQGFFADIWSLGVLLYAMVQGTVPFKASNISDLHKLILAGNFEFPVDSVSEEVKDLIRKMLIVKPEDRINIPQMLGHPWVVEVDKAFETEDYGDEEHDLKVGSTFFRQEVLGGLISGANSHNGNTNGNINFINVENLYYRGGLPVENQPTRPDEKVTYSDYCALTEDFMTYRIDEDAMEIVTGFGYPRTFVIDSINKGDINHATTSYYLLVY